MRIEPNEKYLLIVFDETYLTSENIEALKNYASTLTGKNNYIIVDFLKLTTVDKEKLRQVAEYLQQLVTDNGMIIFSGNNEQVNTAVASTFNDPDLIILPTIDEAIDYIFMDEIEKDLGGEG